MNFHELIEKAKRARVVSFLFLRKYFFKMQLPLDIFLFSLFLYLDLSFVLSFIHWFVSSFFFPFFSSLPKRRSSFSFLHSAPFSLSLWTWKVVSTELIRSWRYSLFQDGQSNCSPPSCPKTNCASEKTIIPEGECCEISKGTFFFFSFVHKPSILTLEIVESAYERKNRELASFTGPQIFAVGRGRRKKKVSEQAKNIPKQAANT